MLIPFICVLLVVPMARSAFLDTDCYVPKASGGLGFCGPFNCSALSVSKGSCVNTGSTPDYQGMVSKLASGCRSCQQSSLTMCTKASLTALIGASSGTIKAAYCNEAYLVIVSNKAPSWTPNLDDVPTPPGGTSADGTECVTRMASITSGVRTDVIPLSFTLLASDSSLNNIASFPNGACDGNGCYVSTASGTYGIPSGGSMGITITGQDIYPFLNNVGINDASQCNLDSCNEHVGQGGGQPHLHGDPFDATDSGRCLYGPKNYTNGASSHPPQLGWSNDGPFIYGRYLSASAPGYSTALDNCGGHSHDGYGYHYHAQNINVTVSEIGGQSGLTKLSSNVTYTSSSPGPLYCWRADISLTPGIWLGNSGSNTYNTPCCNMTQYLLGSGITMSLSSSSTGTGTASSPSPSTSPSPSASSSASASSSNITASVVYTFQAAYATLTSNATLFASFKTAVVSAVASSAGLSSSYVSIKSVVSGSVIVTVQLNLPSVSYSQTQASALAVALTASPSTTFSTSMLSTYGVTGIPTATTDASVATPTPSSSPVLSTGAIIGIAVGGGVGLILAVVLVVVLVKRGGSKSAVSPNEKA